MTKKKSSLWLHVPKRKSQFTPKKDVKRKPPKSPASKRVCTPLHRTPKRLKHSTPASKCDEIHIANEWQDCEDIPCLDKETQTCFVTDCNNSLHSLLESTISKLKESDDTSKLNDFKDMLRLISNGYFPLDNIAFILFLETIRFYATSSTNKMWYSDISKRFWKIGYRLFHGKFLYYMGGPKSIGQVKENPEHRGGLQSSAASINFAVPSIEAIQEFKINEFDIPNEIRPGIIYPILDVLQSSPDKQFMMCADAKKITAGINKKGGDVDMFEHEIPPTLSQRKDRLEDDIKFVDHIKTEVDTHMNQPSLDELSNDQRGLIQNELTNLCVKVGFRVREGRELQFKQKYGLTKFLSMGGDDWRNSKFVFAISSLQASLFQLKEFIQTSLTCLTSLCLHASNFTPHVSDIVLGNTVDASYQENLIRLMNTDDVSITDIETRFVKQRTDLWKIIRDQAKVTGSTLHTGLALRGLKSQREHVLNVRNITPDVQARLDYGTTNEENAVATIVGRFLPLYYPDAYFVEEGCYVLKGNSVEVLMEVSPDGSIRRVKKDHNGNILEVEETIAAVEIKCPFPCDNKLTIHYQVPDYYVCQCMAEMKVLNTQKLVYVSYTPESTTFFQINFSEALWDLIWQETVDIYDKENPVSLTKSRPATLILKNHIKEFTQTNVFFLGEFQSVTMENSGLSQKCKNQPFIYAWPIHKPEQPISHESLEDLLLLLEKTKSCINTGYMLQRKKATEIMVWVLTNKNRNSKVEIPCSIPIAYGLKDYRLTSEALRHATDKVLSECKERGLQILSFSTDGQWIQLMTRDGDNRPLTILQLQKDVWSEVQKHSKSSLITLISGLNIVNNNEEEQRVHIIRSEEMLESYITPCIKQTSKRITLESSDVAFEKIRTSREPNLWKNDRRKTTNNPPRDTAQEPNTDWLPNDIIESIQDNDIGEVIASVNNELNSDYKETVDILQNVEAVSALFSETNIEDTFNLNDDINNIVTGDEPSVMETEEAKVLLNDNFVLGNLLSALKSDEKTKRKWMGSDEGVLKEKLISRDFMLKLTHFELNVLCESLRAIVPTTLPQARHSWKKENKIEMLQALLGLTSLEMESNKKCRRKTAPKLSSLCIKVLRSKSYPKAVLNVAYARYIFQKRFKDWQIRSPISLDVKLEGFEDSVPFWYSYPESNKSSGGLLAKSIDCSHNLTHLRVRTCTTGIAGISSDAWKQCAKSNETNLSVALVDDLIDKQSVPNARTNFALDVEKWMVKNGHESSARLTKLIRNWYDACDLPGIPAIERIQKLLDMRTFLLENVDFGSFPPPGRYIKSIPCVTFEGLCIDIDTKLQMYGLANTYNIRSVGSLAAETTVGVLQALNPNSQVSIKAVDVPSLIGNVTEIMTCKIDKERGFHMRTSKLSGIYPTHESEDMYVEPTSIDEETPTCLTGMITPRDHAFDYVERRKVARRIKFGSISKPEEPSRGALPVRQWHRKDESKILATKRLGLLTFDNI